MEKAKNGANARSGGILFRPSTRVESWISLDIGGGLRNVARRVSHSFKSWPPPPPTRWRRQCAGGVGIFRIAILTLRQNRGHLTGAWHGKSICDRAIRRGDAALGASHIVTSRRWRNFTRRPHAAAATTGRPRHLPRRRRPRVQPSRHHGFVSIKTSWSRSHDADGWISCARPVSTGTTGRVDASPRPSPSSEARTTARLSTTMPRSNMQRITWTVSPCTAGPLPGMPAAHGCGSDPFLLCRTICSTNADRHAGDHLARTRGAGPRFPNRAVHADSGVRRGLLCRGPICWPLGRRGRQDVDEAKAVRDSGARTASLAASFRSWKGSKGAARRRSCVRRHRVSPPQNGPSRRRPNIVSKAAPKAAQSATELYHRQAAAKSNLDAAAAAKDAANADRKEQGAPSRKRERGEARARAHSRSTSPRDAELYVRRNTPHGAGRGRRGVSIRPIDVTVRIPRTPA